MKFGYDTWIVQVSKCGDPNPIMSDDVAKKRKKTNLTNIIVQQSDHREILARTVNNIFSWIITIGT